MSRFTLGRRAGMLFPLSSARSARGEIASFADAPAIARLLKSAGCTMWQLLPLNEVGAGQDSPYSSSSSNALEPVYIDLDSVPEYAALGGEASLTPDEQENLFAHRASSRVDFDKLRKVKLAALRRAFEKFRAEQDPASERARDFATFRARHAIWLDEFTLFRAIHDRREKSWRDWEPPLRDREPGTLALARKDLHQAMDEIAFVQWIADAQWRRARSECNAMGVKLVGDLPFMCGEDSSEVWALQRFFRFDASVGVPPDAYSADGQEWGLPVPRWDEMRAAGDPWLTPRAARAAELYDAFRVDHVVGLYRTYARAILGPHPKQRGPGFFTPGEEHRQLEQGERILTLLGSRAEVLAEDLGTVPNYMRPSLTRLGLPGTKVLRWEVDDGRPRDVRGYSTLSICVTGTHDAEALATWWSGLSQSDRSWQLTQPELRGLQGVDAEKFTARTRDAFLRLAYDAASDGLLIPITDALGWSDRMNTPGTVGPHNWTWRLPWKLGGELEGELQIRAMVGNLLHLAHETGRLR